jgi:hypothetical protein
MQEAPNSVAEIVDRVSASVADLRPHFASRAVGEGRGGEGQDQHQRGAKCKGAASAGNIGIVRDTRMAQG